MGFEDERIEFADWSAKKASMPMGQMPVLNYKGQEIVQSLTIGRFAARKCNLAGDTEMHEFLCDQFVTTLWLDLANKLVESFFERIRTPRRRRPRRGGRRLSKDSIASLTWLRGI